MWNTIDWMQNNFIGVFKYNSLHIILLIHSFKYNSLSTTNHTQVFDNVYILV